MTLVDFDIDIMDELLERGYKHAVIKPLTHGGTTQKINDVPTMEIVPFQEFDEAIRYFDHLEDPDLTQASIVEMDHTPSEVRLSGMGSAHLLIDVESVGLKAA